MVARISADRQQRAGPLVHKQRAHVLVSSHVQEADQLAGVCREGGGRKGLGKWVAMGVHAGLHRPCLHWLCNCDQANARPIIASTYPGHMRCRRRKLTAPEPGRSRRSLRGWVGGAAGGRVATRPDGAHPPAGKGPTLAAAGSMRSLASEPHAQAPPPARDATARAASRAAATPAEAAPAVEGPLPACLLSVQGSCEDCQGFSYAWKARQRAASTPHLRSRDALPRPPQQDHGGPWLAGKGAGPPRRSGYLLRSPPPPPPPPPPCHSAPCRLLQHSTPPPVPHNTLLHYKQPHRRTVGRSTPRVLGREGPPICGEEASVRWEHML